MFIISIIIIIMTIQDIKDISFNIIILISQRISGALGSAGYNAVRWMMMMMMMMMMMTRWIIMTRWIMTRWIMMMMMTRWIMMMMIDDDHLKSQHIHWR